MPDHAPFVPLEGRQAQQVAPIEFVARCCGVVEGEVFTALTGMGQPQCLFIPGSNPTSLSRRKGGGSNAQAMEA